MSDIEAKQKIEIEFWRDSEVESPQADSVHNLINKAADARVFLDCLHRHQDKIVRHGRILELGGGQGWAACIYKKLYPDTHVTATDISEYALMSLPKWERLFEVKTDHSYPCTSYETQEADASVEQIFCFAAAHHFLAHKRTLQEIYRILKPGGKAFYWHEPATPRGFYSLIFKHVNKKRGQIPEDVLITAEIRTLAELAGLELSVDYYPSLLKRGPFETVYFFVLGCIPVLQQVLPCSANFIFTKKSEPPHHTRSSQNLSG